MVFPKGKGRPAYGVGPGSTTSGTRPLLADPHHACIAPRKGIPQLAMIGKAYQVDMWTIYALAYFTLIRSLTDTRARSSAGQDDAGRGPDLDAREAIYRSAAVTYMRTENTGF